MLVPTLLLIIPSIVTAYPLARTTTLNCRSSPSTDSEIVRTFQAGDISISCQTTGTSINGHALWDKTQHDCYVSDYYVKTGTAEMVAPSCNSSPPATTPDPGTTPADVNFPTGQCKSYVVDSGNKLLAQFPGLVHTVWCYADKPGEHGEGRALDFMHEPHAQKGRELAEYVMNNHESLNVMYVIWEQKIWNPSRDQIQGWDNWRFVEGRGSCTQNHCDHVHVSFNYGVP